MSTLKCRSSSSTFHCHLSLSTLCVAVLRPPYSCHPPCLCLSSSFPMMLIASTLKQLSSPSALCVVVLWPFSVILHPTCSYYLHFHCHSSLSTSSAACDHLAFMLPPPVLFIDIAHPTYTYCSSFQCCSSPSTLQHCSLLLILQVAALLLHEVTICLAYSYMPCLCMTYALPTPKNRRINQHHR